MITTKPYNFIDCVTKTTSKESLSNLSVDDLALDEHLYNPRVDILKIAAILMSANCDAVNGK